MMNYQVCPIEKKHKHVTYMKEEHKNSSSEPENGVPSQYVFLKLSEDVSQEN